MLFLTSCSLVCTLANGDWSLVPIHNPRMEVGSRQTSTSLAVSKHLHSAIIGILVLFAYAKF